MGQYIDLHLRSGNIDALRYAHPDDLDGRTYLLTMLKEFYEEAERALADLGDELYAVAESMESIMFQKTGKDGATTREFLPANLLQRHSVSLRMPTIKLAPGSVLVSVPDLLEMYIDLINQGAIDYAICETAE